MPWNIPVFDSTGKIKVAVETTKTASGAPNIFTLSATGVVTDGSINVLEWPAQDSVGYLPAVRNRNGAGSVVAAGRGFGMDTRHAYTTTSTPDILHVDRLDDTHDNADSTHGSLMWCLEDNTGARIIVFDVSGIFLLTDNPEITNGEIWIAGQSAPGPVFFEITDTADFGKPFRIQDVGNVFIQHIYIWCSAPLIDQSSAINVGPDSDNPFNIVLDHCFFGGGTDQTLDIGRGTDVTVVDCITALGRGKDVLAFSHTATNHAFGGIWGEDSTNVSGIGLVWVFMARRNPLWRVPDGTLCNQLTYGCVNAQIEIGGRDPDGSILMRLNVEGFRSINDSGDGPIFLNSTDLLDTNSQLHFSDNTGRNFTGDEWSIVVGDGTADQEMDVRDDTRIAAVWPDGLVAAQNIGLTDAQYITLLTQYVGPQGSSRISWLQTNAIDHIIADNGQQENDYASPTISTVNEAFIEVSDPHGDGVDPLRTRIEEQLLDLSEGFLGTTESFDFPRRSAYAIGGQVYTSGGNNDENDAGITLAYRISILAKCHVVLYGGWRGWSYSGENMQSICGTIKAASSLPVQYIVKYIDIVTARTTGDTPENVHPRNKMSAENGPYGDWWLRNTNGGNTAIQGFGTSHLINGSIYADDDENGYSNAYWRGLFMTADDGDSTEDWARNIDGDTYDIGLGIKPDYDWDGMFFDNMSWYGFTFQPTSQMTPPDGGKPDIDGDSDIDGKDSDEYIAMQAKIIIDGSAAVRFRYPDFLIAGNHGANCDPGRGWDVHGLAPDNGKTFPLTTRDQHSIILLEFLMGVTWSVETWGTWDHMMRLYKNGIFFSTRSPSYCLFGHGSQADGSGNGARPVSISVHDWVLYGLCSCLQDDGYFSSSGESGYTEELQIDEMDYNLGQAVGTPNYNNNPGEFESGYNAEENGVHLREYDNGLAIVNPKANSNQTISLPSAGGGFQWDSFDGGSTNITTVTLDERSGAIIKRVST